MQQWEIYALNFFQYRLFEAFQSARIAARVCEFGVCGELGPNSGSTSFWRMASKRRLAKLQ
jgi:hypothetical protein